MVVSVALVLGAALGGVPLMWWICRQPVRGLYLTIFATSFLITPHLPIVREKVAAPEIMMLLTWTAMLLTLGSFGPKALPVSPAQRTSLMLGSAFAAAVLISFFLNNMLFYGRLTGSMVEAVNYAYGFLMFATTVWLVDDWEKWSRCALAWMGGAALVSLIGVAALAGLAPDWAYDDFTGRISSTLKFENQVPSFLLPIFPAVVFLAVMRGASRLKRFLLALLMIGMIATVIGTGSRTALGMLAICLLGVFWVASREARHHAFDHRLLTSGGLLLALGFVVFVGYVVIHHTGEYRLGETPPWQRAILMLADWLQGERALDSTRPAQLRTALEMLPEFAIFGAGPKLFGARVQVEEIHNSYVGLLIETGLVGFGFFAIWLAHVVGAGWRSAKRCLSPEDRLVALALLVGFAALLAYGLFIFGLRQRNIWILAGLLMALPRLNALSWSRARSSMDQLVADQHGHARRRPYRRFAPPDSRPVR